jgi:hypothetical protein
MRGFSGPVAAQVLVRTGEKISHKSPHGRHCAGPPVAESKAQPVALAARPVPRTLIGLIGALLVWMLMLVALIYAVPVVIGMNHPISALIFACGLWQAWIMTRGREMPVTGPYRIRQPASR